MTIQSETYIYLAASTYLEARCALQCEAAHSFFFAKMTLTLDAACKTIWSVRFVLQT